ncbi:hypothetical protein QAD02_002369 [Eretmocerus hayati]|uniref:Uncharacterized protein n=1 Tax=Eretmocerus hayati TaxID=131215 RepID=A0ACC2NIQ4_9HYME|nr:hypothetical protein QAD02_002369 [Eretmocerus hayati]
MLNLEEIMNPREYDLYTNKQYFAVRRRDVFCSGSPADLVIEQVFMRTMKVAGGLTHGRTTNDSNVALFIMSMILLTDVTYAVELSSSHGYENSEQFSDDRKASIKRDAHDLEKIFEYLSNHNPFDISDTEFIVSISTGLRGDDRVNCHEVFKIGDSLLTETFGKKFGDIHLSRKKRVVSLAAAQSSIVHNEETVRIDPTLLFQRLSMVVEGKDDMKEYLKLELAPYPKSLFDENGMCKTPKHKLVENFTCLAAKPVSVDMKYVIGGGFLLHRVGWSENDLIDDVLANYVNYVARHYSSESVIVFDGYPEIPQARHIKSLERSRRINQNQAREVQFQPGMKVPLSKQKFLGNEKNKNRLISMLMPKLKDAGFTCVQAEEDADIDIVRTAIVMSRGMHIPTMIVGEDIDLLVILTQLTLITDNVYFFKPGRSKIPDRFFSCQSFHPEALTHLVAFFHAFCGCDTVSSIYGKGKNAIVKLFENKPELVPLAESFYSRDIERQKLIDDGIKIMARFYDPDGLSNDLDEIRYHFFKAKTTKLTFELEILPPTNKAAKQHILRTYLQVQIWMGNKTIKATDFGWYEAISTTNTRCLKPIYVEDNILIPPKLMEQISCGCKKGCNTARCSWVRLGVKCTDIRKNCRGTSCSNVTDFPVEVPTDDPNVDEDAGEILNDSQCRDESTQSTVEKEDQYTSTEFRRRDESTSTED